ncbi:response regulator, partial [Mammaliicoccus lentus]
CGYLHFTRSCYGLFYFNHILGVALNITIRHIKSEVSSMDVLIIDDEKNIRQLLKEIFELNQYHVDTAENGQEGINKFLENEYKLIFIDKRMPGISGEKVLFKIRETNPDVPVYIISAFQTSTDIETLTKDNITGVLMKPFTIEEVMKIVRKHLG